MPALITPLRYSFHAALPPLCHATYFCFIAAAAIMPPMLSAAAAYAFVFA
jgi:hypothetical protein